MALKNDPWDQPGSNKLKIEPSRTEKNFETWNRTIPGSRNFSKPPVHPWLSEDMSLVW